MLGHDAFILDRHVIARERHHAPAACAMPCVEREALQLGFDIGIVAHSSGSHDRTTARQRPGRPEYPPPPLSRNLRAVTGAITGLPLRWHGLPRALSRASLSAQAVLQPERFQGGCSFGGEVSPALSRFASDWSVLWRGPGGESICLRASRRDSGTSPLPHLTAQSGYHMGGRVRERAGAAIQS